MRAFIHSPVAERVRFFTGPDPRDVVRQQAAHSRKLTEPKSPEFSALSSVRSAFVVLSCPRTISLECLSQGESRKRKTREEEEQDHYEFKARPVPSSIAAPFQPSAAKKPRTVPEPFHLQTVSACFGVPLRPDCVVGSATQEERGALHQAQLAEQLAKQEEKEKELRNFHAKPVRGFAFCSAQNLTWS